MNLIQALIQLQMRENLSLVLEPRPRCIAITLRRNGTIASIALHEEEVHVPPSLPRTSGLRANILFDSEKYLFEDEGRAVSLVLHRSLLLEAPQHAGLKAVVSFLGGTRPKKTKEVEDLVKKHPLFFVYFLEGEPRPICEDPSLEKVLQEALKGCFKTTTEAIPMHGDGECVIDAHPKIALPGLNNVQALVTMDRGSLAPIFAFPRGHEMLQAPMSFDAMMRYCAALRWLSQRSAYIWDTTQCLSLFFWTTHRHPLEEKLRSFFRGRQDKKMAIADWAQAIEDWVSHPPEVDDDVHVLLLGCGSRIAVRLFETMPLSTLLQRLWRFAQDFKGRALWEILKPYKFLANAVFVERWIHAVLFGHPYPRIPIFTPAKVCALRAKVITSREPDFDTYSALHLYDTIERSHMTTKDEIENDVCFLAGKLFGAYVTLNFYAKDRSDEARLLQQKSFVAQFPVAGFARIEPRADTFAQKVRKDGRPTLAVAISDLKQAILNRGGMPVASTPQQRVYFDLGVNAWRKEYFLRKDDVPSAPSEHPALQTDGD